MFINHKIHTQPLSEKVGKIILNVDNVNLLELDKTEIINLFKSSGVLLFRGFASNTETFKEFSNSLSTDFMDYAGGVFNRQKINDDATILTVND